MSDMQAPFLILDRDESLGLGVPSNLVMYYYSTAVQPLELFYSY